MCVREIWAYTVVRIRVVVFWITNLDEHNSLHLQDSNVRTHLRDQTTYQTGVCLILYCGPKVVSSTAACRSQLKCDGTRAGTRFRFSAKRTSPFKSEGASVQSTTGSRCVRMSDSNAGFPMFRGSVKGTG